MLPGGHGRARRGWCAGRGRCRAASLRRRAPANGRDFAPRRSPARPGPRGSGSACRRRRRFPARRRRCRRRPAGRPPGRGPARAAGQETVMPICPVITLLRMNAGNSSALNLCRHCRSTRSLVSAGPPSSRSAVQAGCEKYPQTAPIRLSTPAGLPAGVLSWHAWRIRPGGPHRLPLHIGRMHTGRVLCYQAHLK